jgi:hypothetical protein
VASRCSAADHSCSSGAAKNQILAPVRIGEQRLMRDDRLFRFEPPGVEPVLERLHLLAGQRVKARTRAADTPEAGTALDFRESPTDPGSKGCPPIPVAVQYVPPMLHRLVGRQ